MKPRLLCITHVDWGHIWQRPHHIAAGLAETCEVAVAYPLSRKRSGVVRHPPAPLHLVPLWRVPGSMRSQRILALNRALVAAQLRALLRRFDPEVVWVTAPEAYAAVRVAADPRTLVYDCMDDTLAFTQDAGVRRVRAQWERELLARADAVFCSSSALAERCTERGAPPERVTLVRNAWDPTAFPVEPSRPAPPTGPLVLGYFGAIGDWLDFAALAGILRADPEVTLRLIGPNECGYQASDPRITIVPPVPHQQLAAAVSGCDVMLLPFRVTDLTRAVDPVKLYEYVALGRPVLAARWPELARFAPYLTFCDDGDDFARRIAQRGIAVAAAPDAKAREIFLAGESWAARLKAIGAVLVPLLERRQTRSR